MHSKIFFGTKPFIPLLKKKKQNKFALFLYDNLKAHIQYNTKLSDKRGIFFFYFTAVVAVIAAVVCCRCRRCYRSWNNCMYVRTLLSLSLSLLNNNAFLYI